MQFTIKTYYHWADIEPCSSIVTWQHAEEIKTMPQSVDVTAERLLPITTSNFGFKKWDLIETNISSLPNLNIFMVSDISTS